MRGLLRICLLMLVCFSQAAGATLLSAWQQALTHDAEFQVAQADRDIAAQELPLARAALLPQVSAQGSLGRAESDISQQGFAGNVNRSTRYYDTQSWALQIRQPLFRSRALIGYQQGKLRAASAEASFDDARQLLALRFIESLGHLVAARAELQFADVEAAAARRFLDQTERQLRAGALTQADRANAALRQVQATQLMSQARATQASAEASWLQVTGDASPPIVSLDPALVEQLIVDGASLDELMARAAERNPAFRARLRERDIARQELRKARGDRLPTLDLLLGRGYIESDAESTIGNTYLTNRVAVQMAVPLFTGGAITATVRQADARLARAEAVIVAAEAQIRSSLVREVAALELARRQADSARSAGEAAHVAQRAAELGRGGGTSTQADLGKAESAMAAAQRDLIYSNALAMISWARIQQVLGTLDDRALQNLEPSVGVE